ncbi:MAG: sarcosine oxidase subunit delta [Luminiphilus sp.]
MKIMNCPLNGPRNISEFVYGGQVKAMPDPTQSSDNAWAEYVFYEKTEIGLVLEWWLHSPSSYWFIAERHNGSDEITRTFAPEAIFCERVDFKPSEVPV